MHFLISSLRTRQVFPNLRCATRTFHLFRLSWIIFWCSLGLYGIVISTLVPVQHSPNARDFSFLYDTTSTLTIRWSFRLVKSQDVLGEMILEIVVFCCSRVCPFLVWNHLWSKHWCSQVLSYWVWLSHLGPTTRTVIWTFTVLFWFRPTDCTLFIHLLFPLSFCYITLKWVRFLT